MANSAVNLRDAWSVYHNQAGLGFLEKIEAGFFYENRFALSELGHAGAAVALPTKSGVFGISASSFGFTLYRESKYGLAYGRKLGEKIAVGVQVDYLSTKFGDIYGSKGTIAGEIGIQAEVSKNLQLGAHIFNVNRARFAEFDEERIPTIMRLGAQYTFSEKVLASLEVEKDIDHSPIIRGGFEYHVVEAFYLRAGASNNPSNSALGFGFFYKNFKFDFAGSFHSVLGFTPHWSLLYQFN